MVTINKINLKQDAGVQKKFLQNIKTVLQKIGSSHKTKAIHKLISNEMLYIGYGASDISRKRNAEYGTFYLKGNKLSGLIADLSTVVDAPELNTMSKKVKDIEKSNKELQRVKSTITDTSAIQLKTLDENISKNFEDLLDSIDYFTLVDVYYYLYVNVLSIVGLKGNGKNKIFDASYNVFKAAIAKILKKLHAKPSNEEIVKIEIIMDYIFARVFTEQSSSTIMAKLNRMHGEEDIKFLKDLKPDSYNTFKSIATMFTKAGIINITESAFMNEFRSLVGESSEASMDGTFDELVAYVVSANYKSSLFDAPNISREDQERLEQLILNFKKDIVLSK